MTKPPVRKVPEQFSHLHELVSLLTHKREAPEGPLAWE